MKHFILLLVSVVCLSAVAHWKFSPEHVLSGDIKTGDLVIKDLSYHGNNIEFKVVKRKDKVTSPINKDSLTSHQQKHWKRSSLGWMTRTVVGTKNHYYSKLEQEIGNLADTLKLYPLHL